MPNRKIKTASGRTALLALCIAAGLLARDLLEPYVAEAGVPFVTFFPAVAAVSILLPAAYAVCSVLLFIVTADYLFFPPAFEFHLFSGSRTIVVSCLAFAFSCAIIIALAETAKRQISRRKRNEADMKVREESLKLAIEGVGMGTWDLDMRTGKLWWSENHFRIWGFEPVPGGRASLDLWRSAVHPDDLERVMKKKDEAERERKIYTTDYRIITPARPEPVWIRTFGKYYYDESGRAVRFAGMFFDNTAEHESIAALKKLTEELKSTNSELEQFAYVASHDLQEPLRTVSTYLDLLNMEIRPQLTPEQGQYLDFALNASLRAQELIRALLEYARIGVKGPMAKAVDMNAILARALENLKVSISESPADIETMPLPVVQADATQMLQVFQNLIGNALKYRTDAPLRIRISAEEQGAAWVFSVRDNGIGIDREYHERIFRIFQRLHDRTKFSGTGIGLAVCSKIVSRHGGRIWVESEPGRGSDFRFSIPRAADPQFAKERAGRGAALIHS